MVQVLFLYWCFGFWVLSFLVLGCTLLHLKQWTVFRCWVLHVWVLDCWVLCLCGLSISLIWISCCPCFALGILFGGCKGGISSWSYNLVFSTGIKKNLAACKVVLVSLILSRWWLFLFCVFVYLFAGLLKSGDIDGFVVPNRWGDGVLWSCGVVIDKGFTWALATWSWCLCYWACWCIFGVPADTEAI